MDPAIKNWVQQRNFDVEGLGLSLKNLHTSYTLYGCMLLLPARFLSDESWKRLRNQCTPEDLEKLYEALAHHLKVTHVAVNQPIPFDLNNGNGENIMRAPSHFTTLYGDFGPSTCSMPPSPGDFDGAFWVTVKQNGINQTWAPRWTMFSRGNVSEKARLLNLASVQDAVELGRVHGQGCAAVDLYAGIGYFAFSYLKAGISKVLCWDINPWSTEGLRRGAASNKWTVVHTPDATDLLGLDSDARVLVFPESNERASERMERMRAMLPPVRHVNCGLLPTSKASWHTAVKVLDPVLGGWMHIHENFAIRQIASMSSQVRDHVEGLANFSVARTVRLEHINPLKTYAPGVMHCVLDIYVGPSTPG